MPDRYLKSLVCPLPLDIERLRGAGEISQALELIDKRLARPLPAMLRERLEAERRLLPQLAANYTFTHEQLLMEMRRRVPSFTDRELNALMDAGLLDFVYIDGTRYYHEDLAASLLKSQPNLARRAVPSAAEDKTALEDVIRRVMDHDVVYRYRLRVGMHVRSFEPGTLYRAHLPLAARSMQQSPAEDVKAEGLLLISQDPEDAPQRTAYLEGTLRKSPDFAIEYTVTQRPRYIDPMDESVRGPVYPDARPVCDDDLAEIPPHLAFTPYIRALAAELREGENDPVRAARKFYDFITENVTYSYMPPYRLLETGAEYCAVNLRGDCGIQALLFIALCRVSGIPARWQSGLCAQPGSLGSHDWAEFYSERLGWLPVDCSFGGGGKRDGSRLRREFYFGNLDPWRMVANRAYYAPFLTAKKYPRVDPYDNQRGEIENDGRGLIGGEFKNTLSLVWHEETEAGK